jgi:hypothetical protein
MDDGCRHVVVVEELAPAGEVLFGSQNDRSLFVETVDQLEQVVSGLPGYGQVTEFINDQHRTWPTS